MIPDRTLHGLPARAVRSILAPASSRDRWWLLALFLLLTIGRMPNIVFQGRFWAEEGTVFYWHAATTAWLPALFYSYAGYMNFGANIAAVAARHLVPLDYAPRITFVFAFAAQICPAILLLTSRAAWLRSRLALAASLLLLVGAPAAEEVWLNTIHSQFYLALCTGLILALGTESGGREIFRRCLLFFAPLYGMVAIIFLPLFILRALMERSRTRSIQALMLASGSAIQLLGFYHAAARHPNLDIKLILGTIYAKNILVPFLGFGTTQPLTDKLGAALSQGILPLPAIVTIALVVVLLFALLRKGPKDAWWLAVACGTVTVVSYYGILLPGPYQVGPHGYERYAFVPQVLFAWTFIAIAAKGPKLHARIAFGLAAWLCVVSIDASLHPGPGFADGPKWSEEMAKWHMNPAYSPVGWPGGQWVVHMPLPRR